MVPGNSARQFLAQRGARSPRWDDALRVSETRTSASDAPSDAGRAVQVVDAAVGQADIVEDVIEFVRRDLAADAGFHQVAEARGLFDACAGLGANVQKELTVVGGGEEVLTEPWDQTARREAQHQKARNEDEATVEPALSSRER